MSHKRKGIFDQLGDDYLPKQGFLLHGDWLYVTSKANSKYAKDG
jgi:hypothetical protein